MTLDNLNEDDVYAAFGVDDNEGEDVKIKEERYYVLP